MRPLVRVSLGDAHLLRFSALSSKRRGMAELAPVIDRLNNAIAEAERRTYLGAGCSEDTWRARLSRWWRETAFLWFGLLGVVVFLVIFARECAR